METQVLVVGAGPVGLTMAAELARYGVSVRIIDKAAERTRSSKAIVIWSRTLELLDRAGCRAPFIAAGHRVDAANIVAGGKVIGHVGFDGIDTPFPYALMLPQSETEQLLERHLETFGVRVERQTELTSFAARADGVVCELRGPAGGTETLHVEWLIGCDGAHSTVRHALGLAFDGNTLQSDWIIADVHMKGLPLPSSELGMYWHQDGVLAVFPISAERYRIVADVGRSVGADAAQPTLEQVQAIVDRRGPRGVTVSDPLWLSAFRINERKVHNYRSGRVFVAGDAAHVHSPAGGQGMNTGMQDAFNLAWKLALVCCRQCHAEKLLDSYGTERSPVATQVLADSGRLTSLALMKNHAAQVVRNAVGHVLLGLAPVREALADTLSEISVAYPHSPLNGPTPHAVHGPAPGDRVAPVANQIPAGAGGMPRFVLFGDRCAGTDQLVVDHGTLLDSELRPPLRGGWMWLVRPDGYVALATREGQCGAIGDYLSSLSRAHS